MGKLPIIFLMGPTASGKTTVAVELVKQLPLDIISVDSAMVYRGMDIGTAKPGAEIQAHAPHRLIDICDPAESYSAGQFVVDAQREIEAIHANGRLPLLTGGTGLYFRALEQGFSPLPEADPEIRARLESEAGQVGWQAMHDRLAVLDPASAARIHPNDPQRIQRALEIHAISGKSPSEHYAAGRTRGMRQPVIKIIINPPERAKLHAAIAKRFDNMLQAGLVDEVRGLYERGDLNPSMPSMRLVGYRQVWSYLDSEVSYNDMIYKGIVATRQLARRQLTWLRSEQNALWVNNDRPELSQFLLNYLQQNPVCADRL